jgi:hypothetical protein
MHLILAFAMVAVAAAEEHGALGVTPAPADLASELGWPGGAAVYHVVPRSPADRAGLKTGDVVVRVGNRMVARFDQLLQELQGHAPGDRVDLEYVRNGAKSKATATLAKRAAEVGNVGLNATLAYLKARPNGGPATAREIADLQWQLGERRAALATAEAGVAKHAQSLQLWAVYLERLQQSGRYADFCAKSLEAHRRFPEAPSIGAHAAEAMLGLGRIADAERLAGEIAQNHFRDGRFFGPGSAAYHTWMDARIRTAQPLEDPRLPCTRADFLNKELAVAKSWRRMLGGAKPYRFARDQASDVPFQRSSVMLGVIPNRMHGIRIKINGVTAPLAIVDTGASHTLIGQAIATEAKVETGGDKRGAHGSLNFTAESGVVRELAIGSVVLKDVPVSVGNPPPLAMTQAKAALGLDLMHQLRFTLDYLNGKARVESSDLPPPKPTGEVWDIPLYTFSDHTLAEGKLSSGASVRVLIDSGNFAQTLIWPTWGKENISNHKGPARDLFAFATGKNLYDLEGLALGGRTLPAWPGMDMPPVTLQGVDLIDLLMGHDLLSQYVVTVDLKNRRLRLESPGGKLQPPKTPKAE